MPADTVAHYVGREKCAECHEKETELWAGSDHDLAMDVATDETVLGDFENHRYVHVAFNDILKLSDADMKLLVENVPATRWAVALHEADAKLEDKVTDVMSAEQLEQFKSDREVLPVLRPCDIGDAHNEINRTIRTLVNDGKITIPGGLVSTFFRRGDKFFVNTDGRDGTMKDFEIQYVFGVRPLQQYLIDFPDGRKQCLGIAWDTDREEWYHLYPSENLPFHDELHWTRPLQNWNYMCAECHSTNLKKNYDVKTDTYHTTWSEIDVSCETCHGPGSIHVELAESDKLFWDRRLGFGLPRLKDADNRVEVETCAPCHARRRVIHPNERDGKPLPKGAGQKLLDYQLPEVFDGNFFYADGQILDEDYVYSSFIQSKMYEKGVRCTDCHDPHSLKVKFKENYDDKFDDNRLCTSCHTNQHPAGKYDTPAHHHHPDSTQPGTKCVECHMPETTYMVADPRRDHSFRSPHPDLTVWLGIPNACNGCHNDAEKGETPEWAAKKVEEWYGKKKESTHHAYAIDAGRHDKQGAQRMLEHLARRKDTSAAVRASAILLLERYPEMTGHAAAIAGLEDPDELVRVAAVRCLAHQPDDQLRRLLAPMLRDSVRAVRTEASRVISRLPMAQLNSKDREAFDSAIAEYFVGQDNLADRPGSHLNKAVVYANLGQKDKAEAAYRQSIKIDPEFLPARMNFATLLNELGRNEEAAEHLRKVIEREPDYSQAHYSLGLLLAEDENKLTEAAQELGEAVRLEPDNAKMRYNYGLALQHLKKPVAAAEQLIAAAELSPGDRQILYALAVLFIQEQQYAKAQSCAEQLNRISPNVPQFENLLRQIQSLRATEEESP